MVDVRSPKEFIGEILAPPEYPAQHAQRGGHIPGAENIPWAQAIKEDGTFKPKEELEAMYNNKGITPEKEVTYVLQDRREVLTYLVLFLNICWGIQM